MRENYLTRDDLVGAVIPNANKVVTAQGIYNSYQPLSVKVNEISNIYNDLPTKEWIESKNYLTAHQSIRHKLDTSVFANVSSTFLTAHQSLSALNNYYLKNETSSATQLKNAFNRGIDTLSIDFARIYNGTDDKWLSSYVGGDISATFIQAVNRINEIDIFCAFDDITTLTTNLDFEDISILSAPTILICQHAGITRNSISVDTIEGIANALNRATVKLKIFGPNTALAKLLRTYMIRNRVLEFQLAVLHNKVQRLQSKDSYDLSVLKDKLALFANTLKLSVLTENPYIYDVTNKTNEIINNLSAAANILNNL